MLKSRNGGSSSSSGKIFNGVRFVLFGFDSVSEAQYRSEIVRRGGIDVGKYDDSCTHAIVSGRVYDDPVCVAARQDGKVVVTELWVDDSVDFGMLADASRIIYRPVKDLDGIPGSESLYICLTGYQRQERDDIMKMVSLMGARFTKPLIANQVTHLICYKFEGEKYELAKKVKIKLVNHRWLIDCLKAWEILPIDDYTKSGWELEVLEAEARDSEEETEDPHTALLGLRSTSKASHSRGEMPVVGSSRIDTSNKGVPNIHQETPAAKPPCTADSLLTNQKLFSTACNETYIGDALCGENLKSNVEIVHQEVKSTSRLNGDQKRDAVEVGGSTIPPEVLNPKLDSISSRSDARCSTLSCSNRTTKKEVMTSNLCIEGLKENTLNRDLDISIDDAGTNREPDHFQNPAAGTVLPQKRKDSGLSPGSKFPKLGGQESKFPSRSPSKSVEFSQLEPTSASPVNHGHVNASSPFEGVTKRSSKDNQNVAPSRFKSLSYRRSLKHGQPTQSNFSKSEDSPTVGSVHDGYTRDALDQPRGVKNELPVSETKDSGALISPSSGMVFGGKPSDDEPKKAMDVDETVEKMATDPLDDEPKKATDVDGSVENMVNGRNKGVKTHKNVSKPEMVSNAENGGDITMKDLSKFKADETRQLQRREQTEEASSLHCSDPETKKPSSTASISACKVTAENESSPRRIKKVVSRRNLSCKSTVNTSKDKHINSSDKSATPKKTEVLSGKTGKLKAKMDGEKAYSKDEKKDTVESASKDLTMEDDRVKPKGRPLSITSGKSTENTSKDEHVNSSDKSATPKTAEVMPGKNEKLKAKMDVKQESSKESASKDLTMEDDRVKPKGRPLSTTSRKKKVVGRRVKASIDPEKENKQKEIGMPSLNANSPNMKVDREDSKKNSKEVAKGNGTKSNADQTSSRPGLVNLEPVWFILSGHRLQRKEFQSVIRRLRGRVCRDPHKWSYQATHFIVPDPVRRTEKFFAAAAAGRWILKTDYLTASNEAGKFLDEEPFEWYNKGLTEDGAISLEAPRKWRHLRERTGHGAFHKMRVIIYGECIAPSLDTLKRVVKAGDGTIVATSPPYTRFLTTGVDFAIVSASMPRVDSWVQEFLSHEIPCVVADYLVEYVCKPGYPLDKHVLYNTNSLAKKSFANLSRLLEEVVEESDDDIKCSVCGSGDGDVILICGDENGSAGCGIGTHIGCCDPPMEAVPDGDWFCPRCKKDSKSNRKRSSARLK